MSEPRPWLESGEAPSEVLALLRAARPSRPLGERARERSRRRVATLVALPAAAGAFMWLQHAAYGALLGVAVTGSVTLAPHLWSAHEAAEERPAPANDAAHRPAKISGSRTGAREMSAPSPSASEPAPRKPTAAYRVDTAEHELSREAKSLEHARSLLASRPAAALSELERHRAEFPHGTLDLERSFLEVEALVKLGRRSEAEALAHALRARAPGSLYEGRLERLMQGGN